MRTPTWQQGILLLTLLIAVSVTAETVPTTQRYKDGKAIYDYVCSRCHDHGEGGAPLVGKPESWSQRSGLWVAVLFEHAEEGFLAMPAGGGDARLSPYDIEVAAEYMVQTTFPGRPED